MRLKGIVVEDFINYKKPSIFIGFPCCTFKCNKESGQLVCQNYQLIKEKKIEVTALTITGSNILNIAW